MSIDRSEPGSDELTTPSVSVVVLSKDEPELGETLDILRRQCEPLGAECIVVDASEKRLDDVRRAHPWVHWIDFVKPLGLRVTIPQQRNAGIAAARSDVVAFCDVGGQPSEGWLRSLTAPLLEGRAPATGGPVVPIGGPDQGLVNDLIDGDTVDHVITCNFAITKSAAAAIGGFDERLEYGSDAAIGWALADAGLATISVKAASMGWPQGTSSLQKARALRYGRAFGRLIRYYSAKHLVSAIRTIPIYAAYSAWIVGLVLSLIVGLVFSFWELPVAWLLFLVLLLIRNRNADQPVLVVWYHLVGGMGTLREIASQLRRPRLPIVMHVPRDTNPYQDQLIDALVLASVEAGYLAEPTSSQTVNIALGPLSLIRSRIRGVKIIHLHWAFTFVPAWARQQWSRRVFRAWFTVWLWTLRHVGLTLVWTVHNVMPHDQIFDDDVAARRQIAQTAGAIIVHQDSTAPQVHDLFGGPYPLVIPGGVQLVDDAPPKAEARQGLGIPPEALLGIFVGNILAYKGLGELFCALEGKREWTVRIMGRCSSPSLAASLAEQAAACRASGVDVTLSIGFVPDDEVALWMASADWVLAPFQSVTNSSSVTAALGAGLPLVIPALRELSRVPAGAAVRYEPGGGIAALQAALDEAARRQGEAVAMGQVGRSAVAEDQSWEASGRAVGQVYRDLLEGKAPVGSPPKTPRTAGA